jgi:hypothetical protein
MLVLSSKGGRTGLRVVAIFPRRCGAASVGSQANAVCPRLIRFGAEEACSVLVVGGSSGSCGSRSAMATVLSTRRTVGGGYSTNDPLYRRAPTQVIPALWKMALRVEH